MQRGECGIRSHEQAPYRRTPDERGAAAVEFALLAPLVLLLIFGAIEYGRLLSTQHLMQNAARDAARAIALEYDDPSATPALLDERVDDILDQGLGGTSTWLTSRTWTLCSTADPDGNALVALSWEPTLSLPDLGIAPADVTVEARAVMPCEG